MPAPQDRAAATPDAPAQPEAIDGTAVELAPADAPSSTAVVRRERRSEVIRPLSADDLVESFQAYQELLPKLLDAGDYQAAGRDRHGNPRRFVKKSGWRKIATAFDLDVILIADEVERDAAGHPVRAKAIARAIAPSGRAMDGDGYCDAAEERFERQDGRKKLENDLRTTATTRAKNRAIADLVGMGEVSAEEVSPADTADAAPPAASDALIATMVNALAYVFGGDAEAVAKAGQALTAQYGGEVPAIAAQAVVITASAIKRHREGGTDDPDPQTPSDADPSGDA